MVLVECSCLNRTKKIVRLTDLKTGNTTSCGCITIERLKKHGYKNHHLYDVWNHMIQRCTNKNHKQYASYGGRGITVCNRWEKIETFIEDMSKGWKQGLTIDRIDNDKGYSPENCRWANQFVQSRNKRSNVNITLDGRTQCLMDWCIEKSLNYQTVCSRIRSGQTFEKSLQQNKNGE